MVLAGDIGGTNCRYALFDGKELHHIRIWPTSQSRGVADDLKRYQEDVLSKDPSLSFVRACVAIAGPVSGDRVSLTNADWSGALSDFPCPAVWVNDLVAAAQGLDIAQSQQIWGPKSTGVHRVALGVGTGFGQALRVRDDVFPAEGGHASYAPNTKEEQELLMFLSQHFDRVRVEDVCSGTGMNNIRRFLECKYSIELDHSVPAGKLFGGGSDDPIVSQGLDLFLSSLASVIADTALRQLPNGGIWLCGGVAKKMLSHYSRPSFLQSLQKKEPMNEPVALIPIFVVLEEELGLMGAGYIADQKRCGFQQKIVQQT